MTDKLRDFVIAYPLPTGVMTEQQWMDEFKKFKQAILKFKENNK